MVFMSKSSEFISLRASLCMPHFCRNPALSALPFPSMNATDLEATARSLVLSGRGILAADESIGTITKRFAAVNVESTESNRRDYRETLFATTKLGESISGVILFDETLRQKTA